MIEIYRDQHYSVAIADEGYSTTLFNRDDFIHFQQQTFNCDLRIFCLVKLQNNKVIAALDFAARAQSRDRWFTPVTGAFSDIFSISNLSSAELELFIQQITQHLLSQEKATAMLWKTPPLYFNSTINSKLHNTLYRLQWQIDAWELNFHLAIADHATFRSRLSDTKRKELNKLNRSGTEFSLVENEAQMRDVYEVIRLNREAQGYPMTMSWEALFALKTQFADDVFFAQLLRDDTLLAGAILLKLNASTLYVFYWGEHPDSRNESPVVKLCEHLYLLAAETGVRYLDIGISTADSQPNEGLMNFKTSLGCETSQKLIFSYSALAGHAK